MGHRMMRRYGSLTLRRKEKHFGFAIAIDGSGEHELGVSIKKEPSSFDVRFTPDYFRFAPRSGPLLRVPQTAAVDPQRKFTISDPGGLSVA